MKAALALPTLVWIPCMNSCRTYRRLDHCFNHECQQDHLWRVFVLQKILQPKEFLPALRILVYFGRYSFDRDKRPVARRQT